MKKDGNWIVRAASKGRIATIQVDRRGRDWLRRRGMRGSGEFIDWDWLSTLGNLGYTYTSGGEPGYLDGISPSNSEDRLRRIRELERRGLRASLPKVRTALREVFSGVRDYRGVLRLAALTVREANKANPETWTVSVSDNGPTVLAVTVGRIEVMAASRGAEVRVVVHVPWVADWIIEDLRAKRMLGPSKTYKTLPRARPVTLRPNELIYWYYPYLQRGHTHVIRAMSYQMDSTPYTQTYSPGLLKLLRTTGLDLPGPEWAKRV
jgi:hypothetical protein